MAQEGVIDSELGQEGKLQLMDPTGVPSGTRTPWPVVCRGVLIDVDFFRMARRPSWCGGLSFLLFLVTFFVIIVIELIKPIPLKTITSQLSTAGKEFEFQVTCENDALLASNTDGLCFLNIVYNKTQRVYDSSSGNYILVDHPCHRFNADIVVNVGAQFPVTLCYSDGINDGLIFKSTPGLSRVGLQRFGTKLYVSQDANGAQYFHFQQTLFIDIAGNEVYNQSLQVFQFTQTDLQGNATSAIRASDTYLQFKEKEDPSRFQSAGELGGICFFIFLGFRLLADFHWRCTKPYAGSLVEPTRPNPAS